MIGVIGAASAGPVALREAQKAGALIAEAGAVLVCGGLGGVMKAACKGVKSAGGITIGILPGANASAANEYVDFVILTAMNHARNVIITNTAEAFIAIDGSYGTLSEIAFALKYGKPVAGINTHEVKGVIKVKDAKTAVKTVMALIKK